MLCDDAKESKRYEGQAGRNQATRLKLKCCGSLYHA